MTYLPTANAQRERFAYLPTGWDRGWRSAKAAGVANIAILGDSWLFGTGASDPNRTSLRGILRDQFVAQIGQGADYFPCSQSVGASLFAGTATSATANTLTQTGAGWTVNAYTNAYVCILTGTGAGQARLISSNTSTVLTLSTNWTTNPVNGSTFEIRFWDGYEQHRANPGWLWTSSPWIIGTTATRTQPYGYSTGNAWTGSLGSLMIPMSAVGGEIAIPSPADGVIFATFTAPSWLGTITDFDVVFARRTAHATIHPFKYELNSTGVNNNSGLITVADEWVDRVNTNIRGLTAASGHIIKVKGAGAGQTAWVSGVTAYKSLTTGARVAHLGMGGMMASRAMAPWCKQFAKNLSGPAGANAGFFPQGPDLVIMDFAITEGSVSGPDIAFSRLGLMVQQWRAAKPDCAIVLMLPFYPNGFTADGMSASSAFSVGYDWFRGAAIGWAQSWSIACFDLHARWNNRTSISTYYDDPTDTIHTNDLGYADAAAWIGAFL